MPPMDIAPGRSHLKAVGAAWTEVDLAGGQTVASRPPPSREVLRLSPCFRHERSRRVEYARNDELAFGRLGDGISRHRFSPSSRLGQMVFQGIPIAEPFS